MFLNTASKIIISILLPEIESFLESIVKTTYFSISPIMRYTGEFSANSKYMSFDLFLSQNRISIYILPDNFTDELYNSFSSWHKEQAEKIRLILTLICKKNISIINGTEIIDPPDIQSSAMQIDVSCSSGEDTYIFSLVIPDDFFRQVLKKKEISEDPENLEEAILDFFINPNNTFPALKPVLDVLSDLDLQKLLYRLQKNNLLTAYQICLLVRSFPEHSGRIKRNISKNRIKDVTDMLDKLSKSKSITRRDLQEGVYSIEEAIYKLMKKDREVTISVFLSGAFADLHRYANLKKIMTRGFSSWIREINESGLLSEITASMTDNEIARAFSDRAESFFEVFNGIFSDKKINALLGIIREGKITYSQKMEAQCKFIVDYRRSKIRRLNPGPEKFRTMLSKMTGKHCATHLLCSAGWFALSTAFKTGRPLNQLEKKKILALFDEVPSGAKYLILDVLEGTVNPNIIQDEMQINRARSLCVREMASLYEEGSIDIF